MNICPTCGQPTEDGAVFCRACGCALMQEEPAAEQPAAEQPQPKKPFHKRRLAVALGSAAVVLVAVIAAVALFFEPILQTVMPAGTYLRRVGKAKAATLAADVGAMVDEQASVQGAEASSTESVIEWRFGTGQKAKGLISKLQTALGLDLSGFEKITLSVNTQQKEDAQQAKAELLINGASRFTALCQADPAAGSLLLYLPDLNRQPLHLDMTELTRLFAGSAALMPQESLAGEMPTELLTDMPDGKTLENILVRVLTAAIDTVKDAKKKSMTLTADGVSQKGTAYTVELTEDLLARAGEAVLQTVRDDPDVRQLLETAQEGMYDTFVEEIDKALAELKKGPPAGEEDSLAGTTVSVFVDKEGDVRGLWIEQEEKTVFTLACPKDGDRFGVLLDVTGAVKISGSGKKDGEKRSGTFALSLYETSSKGEQEEIPALTVRTEGLYRKEGVQKGTVIVEPAGQLIDKLGLSDQLAAFGLSKPSLCLSLDCEPARQELTLSAQDEGEELAALSVCTRPGQPFEDAIPGNAAKIRDLEDVFGWLSGCEGELGQMLKQLAAEAVSELFNQAL
ncbi:MAG: zinc ribbon domain-containing protein [Clostridia bacterium]|nr:zinc ribbon domain-containing protein [Clostridia bacterium]